MGSSPQSRRRPHALPREGVSRGIFAVAAHSLLSGLTTPGPVFSSGHLLKNQILAHGCFSLTALSERTRPAPSLPSHCVSSLALNASCNDRINVVLHVCLFLLVDSGLHERGVYVSVFSFTGAPQTSISIQDKNERPPKLAG